MKNYKKVILVLAAMFVVASITAIGAFRTQEATATPAVQEQDNYPHLRVPPGGTAEKLKKFKDRLKKLPLADYNAPEPTDPEKRAKRHSRNQAYNHTVGKDASKLRWTELAVIHNDWEFGLKSTLPATQSSAIVVGEVTRAEAYVSEDKTNVYSEFVVRVEEVIKNDSNEPITIGESIVTERLGGRIRMPQGISTYIVAGQFMPDVGSRYVFFLGYNPREAASRSPLDMSRHILTAFELSGDKVHPLDFSGGGIFKEHAGKRIADFIAQVKSAAAETIQTSHK